MSLAAMACGAAWAQDANPVVHTALGDVRGRLMDDGHSEFRGMPYARPPVGALRWAPTQAAEPWTGVRDATSSGAACPQAPHPFSDTLRNSEDCLFLDVYVPPQVAASAAPRPVIVWIPGGGTVVGSARQYDASKLAKATGAVVVSINYRLGALGWLWTSGMTAQASGGNFALQDQQEALRWVQRNIASFHGDAGKVTLVGESIGANSASLHLVSPTAAGLFHRVVLASGVEPPGILTPAQAAAQGDVFAAKLGCAAGPAQLSCLRGKSPQELLAITPGYSDLARLGLFWRHFVDGKLIVGDVATALSSGKFNRVPIMVGTTQDEGRGFIPLGFDLDGTPMTETEYVEAIKQFLGPQIQSLLTNLMYPTAKYGSPALAASQVWTDVFACQGNEVAKRATGQVPVYAYEFADRNAPEFVHDPFVPSGAFHASDLLYWFQTPPGGAPLTLSPAQARLSDQMQRYWKNFAETGNPNEPEGSATALPAWPKFNKLKTPYLSLVPDASSTLDWGAFQRAHQCGVWSILFSLRSLGAV
jgi:para-nitrobenzyl esterase